MKEAEWTRCNNPQAILAVLADVLEDAGCGHEEVLSHLRQQEAVHVRGCWGVDLLTGRQ